MTKFEDLYLIEYSEKENTLYKGNHIKYLHELTSLVNDFNSRLLYVIYIYNSKVEYTPIKYFIEVFKDKTFSLIKYAVSTKEELMNKKFNDLDSLKLFIKDHMLPLIN